MPAELRLHVSRGLRMGLLIAGIVGLATGVLAWFQLQREHRIDLEDQDRRAHMLSHQIKETVQDSLKLPDKDAARSMAPLIASHRRLMGFAVYRADGTRVAAGKEVGEFANQLTPIVRRTLSGDPEVIETARFDDTSVHILATLLTDEQGTPAGVLVAVHDISYLDERAATRQIQFAFGILLVVFLLLVMVVAINWAAYERP